MQPGEAQQKLVVVVVREPVDRSSLVVVVAAGDRYEADRQACHSGRARCALASALVKVARLAPPATPIADPVCTLVEGGEIASRVQRLLEDAPAATPPRAAWHWPALALGSTAVALAYAPLLRGVHALTELIVHSV